MAETLILYRRGGASELQLDVERRAVCISFSEADVSWSPPERGQRRSRWDGALKSMSLRLGNMESRTMAFLEARHHHRRTTIALGKGDLFGLEELMLQAVAAILGWK
jgi:hypothetical protein